MSDSTGTKADLIKALRSLAEKALGESRNQSIPVYRQRMHLGEARGFDGAANLVEHWTFDEDATA